MKQTADVCMLVEGTYPYVSGGVSSWIHGMITNLSEFTFVILHISSTPVVERVSRYTLPANVIGIEEIYLHDLHDVDQRQPKDRLPTAWHDLCQFHDAITDNEPYDIGKLLPHFATSSTDGLKTADLLFSKKSWEMLVARYTKAPQTTSFLDFLWTFRATHVPLFRLLSTSLPPARLFHAPSAGFCGFIASLGKIRTGAPFLLTEHGNYMHERELEIAQAAWIPDRPQTSYRLDQSDGFFRQWWKDMFRFMTHVTYDYADKIISLTQGNQRYQLQDGADPHKMLVIPNGIDINRLRSVRSSLGRQSQGFIVGFVGRVVPIKDVKTFIRAMKAISETIDGLTVYIVGPTEEDPAYFAECEQLVKLLKLESIVTFTGRADVRDYYSKLDVLVLTSLSEAQPLVILEANCAGVPAVATNVGACQECLLGETPEDQALGPSGIVTTVASPAETADAIIRLWRDEDLRQQMARTGQTRVEQFYREGTLYDTYRSLYQQFLDQSPVPPVSG